jgi:hypothetical protein
MVRRGVSDRIGIVEHAVTAHRAEETVLPGVVRPATEAARPGIEVARPVIAVTVQDFQIEVVAQGDDRIISPNRRMD